MEPRASSVRRCDTIATRSGCRAAVTQRRQQRGGGFSGGPQCLSRWRLGARARPWVRPRPGRRDVFQAFLLGPLVVVPLRVSLSRFPVLKRHESHWTLMTSVHLIIFVKRYPPTVTSRGPGGLDVRRRGGLTAAPDNYFKTLLASS